MKKPDLSWMMANLSIFRFIMIIWQFFRFICMEDETHKYDETHIYSQILGTYTCSVFLEIKMLVAYSSKFSWYINLVLQYNHKCNKLKQD